ncbi:MAG: hypothetical protein KGO93_05420 [Cyanobacteria bacterium REEB446]|jgi:hypothetical protein|nr:hypothetical protein [Cyanobacteria bacterium REEB446]
MGEPKNIQKLDGSQAYVYGFSRMVYVPASTVARTNSACRSLTTLNTYGGYYQNYYCVLKFFANGSKIRSATYEGNSCLTYAKHR